MAERYYLTVGEVLQIHLRLINDYGGTHGILDGGRYCCQLDGRRSLNR